MYIHRCNVNVISQNASTFLVIDLPTCLSKDFKVYRYGQHHIKPYIFVR